MSEEVTFVSTPNDGSCGIGTYAASLKLTLPSSISVNHIYLKLGSLNPFLYAHAAVAAGLSDDEVVHVQHEYGLFGPKSLMSWVFFPILYLFTTLTDKRVVLTMHSAWNSETIDPPLVHLKRIYVALNNRMIVTAGDLLIFLSENCKDEFLKSVDVGSCEVLPHGVQTEETIDMSQAEAKQRFGYDPGDTVLVEPGFVRPEKGPDIFVDLARELPDREFLLAGGEQDGYDGYLDELAADAPTNVQITGVLPAEDFHAAFVAADLVVLPYREVTQSGIFNFCAAYQTPVATSDVDYFRNLTEEWGCVERFTLADRDDMEHTVRNLLENEAARESLVAGMAEYREAKSMRKIGDHHERMYRNTCENEQY